MLICVPTGLVPFASVWNATGRGGVAWASVQPGSPVGPATPPCTGVGAAPVGAHAGGAFGARHRPPAQVSCAFAQVPEQETKQKEPVEVLTQLLPDGQVLWSAGLHAEVQAPPGNSGPLLQISPAAHPAGGQTLPRSALAGRSLAGQLAAGTEAPNPGQHV